MSAGAEFAESKPMETAFSMQSSMAMDAVRQQLAFQPQNSGDAAPGGTTRINVSSSNMLDLGNGYLEFKLTNGSAGNVNLDGGVYGLIKQLSVEGPGGRLIERWDNADDIHNLIHHLDTSDHELYNEHLRAGVPYTIDEDNVEPYDPHFTWTAASGEGPVGGTKTLTAANGDTTVLAISTADFDNDDATLPAPNEFEITGQTNPGRGFRLDSCAKMNAGIVRNFQLRPKLGWFRTDKKTFLHPDQYFQIVIEWAEAARAFVVHPYTVGGTPFPETAAQAVTYSLQNIRYICDGIVVNDIGFASKLAQMADIERRWTATTYKLYEATMNTTGNANTSQNIAIPDQTAKLHGYVFSLRDPAGRTSSNRWNSSFSIEGIDTAQVKIGGAPHPSNEIVHKSIAADPPAVTAANTYGGTPRGTRIMLPGVTGLNVAEMWRLKEQMFGNGKGRVRAEDFFNGLNNLSTGRFCLPFEVFKSSGGHNIGGFDTTGGQPIALHLKTNQTISKSAVANSAMTQDYTCTTMAKCSIVFMRDSKGVVTSFS